MTGECQAGRSLVSSSLEHLRWSSVPHGRWLSAMLAPDRDEATPKLVRAIPQQGVTVSGDEDQGRWTSSSAWTRPVLT